MFQRHDWERSATARAVVAFGVIAFLAFCVGCMSLNFGGKSDVVAASDAEVAQKGKAFIRPGDEICIYYPTPFQSPPNLELVDPTAKHVLQITEQRADSFRARNMGQFGVSLAWEARGVKVAPNVVPAAATSSPGDAASTATRTAERAVRNP
jgi:hypothetical protein